MGFDITKLGYDFDAENRRVRKEAEERFRAAVAEAHKKAMASSSMETKWVMSIDGMLSGKPIDAIEL